MQSFNPTAPARGVIEAGLVCEDLHRFLFRHLAARADLEPGSQQLLVGGVGSGKTTELLLGERWLREQGHALPLYIDISAETDLSSLNSGSLLASFGVHLGWSVLNDPALRPLVNEKTEKLKETYSKVTEYAYGKQVKRRVDPLENLGVVYGALQSHFVTEELPGKLKPVLARDIREIRQPLEEFLSVAREVNRDVVVIFDGLDRLLDPTKFLSVANQDLRLFRELKVSILATAPLSALFGAEVGQSISDHFDRVHHLSVIAADPRNGSLRSVLEKRRGSELLSEQDADSICHYSGGVLRDLISLARDAAEEAYVSDRDSITAADVEKVVHQLGTGYLRGLGPEAIKTLLNLESSKSFQVDQAANVELLLTRRVLEYSSTDFRVHPALLSVIPRTEPKRA
ncbi:MAG: hypothetical protein ABSA59_06495 [Terriglobia bacterium]|jgi:hypothetical protein